MPAIIAAAAFGLAWSLQRSDSSSAKTAVGAVVLGVGWWAAVTVSLSARQEWQVWPTEYWHHCLWPLMIWPLIAWSFIGSPTGEAISGSPRSTLSPILLAIAAAATAAFCLPRGEAWEDTYSVHGPVGVALMLSIFVNAWSLDAMARRGTERWVLLVALASLGGPIALAASTYASLTEWGLAMASATLAITIGGLLVRNRLATTSIAIVVAGSACLVAGGRFQTYEDHPLWLYALLLSLPSVIAFVDYFLKSRSTAVRVVVAAILSAATIATSVWFLLIRETETW